MTEVVSPTATEGGPANPTPDAVAALRPLRPDGVRLDPGGLLGGWQERNAAATLPHCIAQLEVSGNLDNLRRVVGRSDRDFTGMWFADSDIYKTLEAVAWELGRPDGAARQHLGGVLDEWAALLAEAQDDDGYLNSYFQVDRRVQQWRELRWSHELYCAGHLIQAAVAAARVGVGERFVRVARRFADLIVARFGPDGIEAVCGHPIVETALVELYRVTGHRPYLDLARRFVALRGHGLLGTDKMGRQYYQDRLPVLEAEEVTGHAVRQLYLLAGAVDVAVETGDTQLLAATERLWESAFNTKTYLTGAHGSRHRDEAFGDPYELPPDRAYGETCAAIASFQWNWRMLLATGRHRYADEMERVLYNGIAAATALDGTNFFYSNPLQLRAGHDGSNEDAPSRRLPWYSCSCCPPNLSRLMASLHSYVATVDANGMQVHLYSTATLATADGPSGSAEVSVDTGYPWTGRITLTVRRAPAGPWTLALRIPDWCAEYGLDIDGLRVDAGTEDGYLRLTRHWSPGTSVVLDLRMPPRMLAAHPHVDAVRGCVALARGPLVYCLEQADLPPDTALEDVRLDTATAPRADERDGSSPIPVTLTAQATVGVAPPALYRDHETADATEAAALPVTAVPYFLWGNRESGPMRVWIPASPSTADEDLCRKGNL
ncbi:glycoside hydrolase family 127 protein [Rugosimonospora africana]|uniref:Glycoside hydrolase family 127 protein n=1 Tax=Rugosimonospora africana TaxID=556532 RepID=A0A8J3QSE1_9ACTN|nr:beta-L-arabinofuranosidase domain-containing protein [Rugosimonospora africana]GIH14885.1 hypothetical protein Raf01_30570 [Rugosimonospora africana]